MNKLQKARVIIAADSYRQAALQLFEQEVAKNSDYQLMLAENGEGSLKLFIERIKDDLLQLETKLENLL